MLKIVGIGVAAAVTLLVGLAPVAFAEDNTKESEPQVCGNQPFQGLALGILGLDSFQRAEKHQKCDDTEHHETHKSHD